MGRAEARERETVRRSSLKAGHRTSSGLRSEAPAFATLWRVRGGPAGPPYHDLRVAMRTRLRSEAPSFAQKSMEGKTAGEEPLAYRRRSYKARRAHFTFFVYMSVNV
jgi:hypothetical protein